MKPRPFWKIALALLAVPSLAYLAFHSVGREPRAATSPLPSAGKQSLEQRAHSALSVTDGSLKLKETARISRS